VPAVPLRERTFGVQGRELTPLAGSEIPIPPDQEEDFLARYEQWRAIYNGSIPEYIVFDWLVTQKKQRVQADFVFQHPMFGGRTRYGGFILDFYFPKRREGWRVQGERWHLEKPESRARDAIAKVMLMQQGIRIVDLWEDDLLSRPEYVLNLAWERSAGVPARSW
jgi:hypothetical protein